MTDQLEFGLGEGEEGAIGGKLVLTNHRPQALSHSLLQNQNCMVTPKESQQTPSLKKQNKGGRSWTFCSWVTTPCEWRKWKRPYVVWNSDNILTLKKAWMDYLEARLHFCVFGASPTKLKQGHTWLPLLCHKLKPKTSDWGLKASATSRGLSDNFLLGKFGSNPQCSSINLASEEWWNSREKRRKWISRVAREQPHSSKGMILENPQIHNLDWWMWIDWFCWHVFIVQQQKTGKWFLNVCCHP